MRPPPSTAEYIETLAAAEPRRLALREGDSELDYAQLHGFIAQCGLELQRLGVGRGTRVAVAGPGFGIQLVLLLAAESLGAVTATFEAADDPDADWLFTQVDRVFACREQAVPPNARFHLVDAAFAQRLALPPRAPGPAWDPPPLHEPHRITRTSGSGGRAKFMLLPRQAQEWQIRTALDTRHWEMEPGTRLLVLSPLVVNAGFARASGCLRRGGAVLAGGGGDIAALDPTHIIGLPLQLERLLAELPPGYAPPRPVQVATFGGPLAPQLRERTRAVFGATVANRYGSNEAGGICDAMDATGAGVVIAGVEVRILDADGRDLPLGERGIVAVRSPALVEGYLERPQETAAAFRDGWFVSGDFGMLLASRVLRLAGRHDELVTLGGIKVPAAQLEQQLRSQPSIADAAVVAVHIDEGAASLGIAVVAAAGADPAGVGEQVRAALQLAPAAAARILLVSGLPRLAGGKTDRMALLRLFAREGD